MDQYEWLRDDVSHSNAPVLAPVTGTTTLTEGEDSGVAVQKESSESSEPQMFAVFKQRAPSSIASAIDSEAGATAAPDSDPVIADGPAVESTNEMEEEED